MTQLIDRSSVPVGKSELDLFSVPSTQVAIKGSKWVEINPLNTLTHMGPFEFRVPSDPHYLDLARNYLYLKIKITRANDADLRWNPDAVAPAPIHDEDKVGPINLIGKTFFKQVKLFLNSNLVYDSGDMYAYRAYIETHLGNKRHYKDNFLMAGGFHQDTPAAHVDDDENEGWTTRCLWFQTSVEREFMAPLHVDLFHQEKYLINQVEVRLELHRNDEPFALISHAAAPNFNIKVLDMKWYVKKIIPADSVSLALEKTVLSVSSIKYPIRRVQAKAIQIEAGRFDTPVNTIFSGQIPRRLVVGLVVGTAFHGAYARNPFNFQHFSASSIQVTAGGVDYPPNPIRMNFAENLAIRPFVFTQEALGWPSIKDSCFVNIEDFANGDTIYVFDLAPSSDDDSNWELLNEGTTTIRMTFANAIPAGGAKMIVLGEFDNLLTVDRFRNVYSDYTP